MKGSQSRRQPSVSWKQYSVQRGNGSAPKTIRAEAPRSESSQIILVARSGDALFDLHDVDIAGQRANSQSSAALVGEIADSGGFRRQSADQNRSYGLAIARDNPARLHDRSRRPVLSGPRLGLRCLVDNPPDDDSPFVLGNHHIIGARAAHRLRVSLMTRSGDHVQVGI